MEIDSGDDLCEGIRRSAAVDERAERRAANLTAADEAALGSDVLGSRAYAEELADREAEEAAAQAAEAEVAEAAESELDEYGIAIEGADQETASAQDAASPAPAEPRTARVLEVGCGTGCISLSLAWERRGHVTCTATDIEPRAIDREVSQSLHMTHMGCSSLPEALIKQSLRAGLSDGWGGSMMGTEFSDILFGTPRPLDTTANIGVMEKDMVNIIVHGHDPSLSEMIVMYSQDPEMVALAKSVGAKGINIAGVCCTGNEVAMRQGIPMAGNFLQQENVVLTGACEAIVVDVQCIFPALGPLSKCFHTKFITTSPIARMPDSDFIEFHEDTAADNAKAIIKMAVENFKNRKPELVNIPNLKTKARVGYSVEAIKKELDGVCNTHVDAFGTLKPLADVVKAGVLRGAVAMVGCNNPKVRPDTAHIELMKKLLKNDIIVIVSGCSAQAAAKAGLMDLDAAEYCGEGLRRVCKLVGIPPVLHMGSCVDISRMMILASDLAKDWGINISQIPLCGCAPEWMSEKAVSIGNYVVATGIDTYLGVDPYSKGSSEITELLQGETRGCKEWVEAHFVVDTNIESLGDKMIAAIEAKRAALGI